MSKRKSVEIDNRERWHELFRTWEEPSFSNSTCWVVSAVVDYRTDYPLEFLKVKVEEWDLHVFHLKNDINKCSFKNAEENHDLYTNYKPVECMLPVEEFTPLYLDIKNAKIPIIGFAQIAGFDGTYYGFHCSECFTTVDLKWWCDLPEEWREFTMAVNNMQEFLKSKTEQLPT